MSDETITKNITVPRRQVRRDKADGLYYVMQSNGQYFEAVSRGYRHSTSCYAVLGRMVNKEGLAENL